MSVDLDVAGSEDDAIARNFLVLPQVDDVSHLVKRVRLEILNVEKTTLPCACTLSLIQCHSVWGINWRTESLQGIDFAWLNNVSSNWNVHLDIHALDHTRCFALDNWNLQGVCPVVLLVPETVHICLEPYSSLVVVSVLSLPRTLTTQCVGCEQRSIALTLPHEGIMLLCRSIEAKHTDNFIYFAPCKTFCKSGTSILAPDCNITFCPCYTVCK